jgi:hypothetical protein
VTAILAIDPGTTHSGWCFVRSGSVKFSGVYPNHDILTLLRGNLDPVAIEMIASYGMPVGSEVFETCVWIGRFMQEAARAIGEDRTRLIYRRDVKLHLCGSPRAKDANIRQALVDRYGGKAAAIGTKKQPGPLYGVKSHAWAALGVAITAQETDVPKCPQCDVSKPTRSLLEDHMQSHEGDDGKQDEPADEEEGEQ